MNNPTNHVQVSDIRNWLSAFLERQNVTDVEIAITGTSYRGTGYLSDITYVDLTHKKSKDKLYRFAIKSSKPILKEVLPLRNMNLNEMLFYTFLPALNRILLQLDTGLIFHNVPKFYESVVDPEKEIMVLQDMRREGYHMFNRRLHLNEVHLKRVMAVYAKLHAVTLAFQIRRDYFFQSFCSHLKDTVGEIKTQELLKEQEFLADLEAMARNEERTAVANYLHKLLKWTNYTTATDDISVVIHGDATICNFLFKYEVSPKRMENELLIMSNATVSLESARFRPQKRGRPLRTCACWIFNTADWALLLSTWLVSSTLACPPSTAAKSTTLLPSITTSSLIF
jgi:hypothetical protein